MVHIESRTRGGCGGFPFCIVGKSAAISPLRLWRGFSLVRRFATIAVALSFASTLAIGAWVSHKIEEGILSRSSGIGSVYVSDLPVADDAGPGETGDHLSRESLDKLDTLLLNGALRLRIVAIKIWSEDGTVIYSSDPRDDRPAVRSGLEPCQRVQRRNRFRDRQSHRTRAPRSSRRPRSLLKIYAPIYESTVKVLARGGVLRERRPTSRVWWRRRSRDSSAGHLLVLACNVLAFFAIVHGGGKTIEAQRSELTQRIDELSQAMSREKALHDHVEQGAQQVFDENERFLRALGSDLHDGPAQLIGLALLKLEPVAGARSTKRPCCRRGPP